SGRTCGQRGRCSVTALAKGAAAVSRGTRKEVGTLVLKRPGVRDQKSLVVEFDRSGQPSTLTRTAPSREGRGPCTAVPAARDWQCGARRTDGSRGTRAVCCHAHSPPASFART